ncbi:MAG: cryptochrome/photolyase family protein [Hyphomonadaceae bacterium]|nr:cryptochrome/photolyase family protein [Hyphomonadaceae bacterium]
MPALRLILGDQLSPEISSLRDIDPQSDMILIAEVMEEATYVRHHMRKIAFLFSAMRHFAIELESAGYSVRYVRLDDEENLGSLRTEVARTLEDHPEQFDRLVITKPGEWRLLQEMETWSGLFEAEIELRGDDRFIASLSEFEDWAEGRKQLRMEYFYREMRKKTGLLMEGEAPAGGKWNFDQENRKRLPKTAVPPPRKMFTPDKITSETLDLVEARFGDHFGSLESFDLPVTRKQAEAARDHFMYEILPGFGDYQDAMATGEAFLWHSLLSATLNCGLLDPLDLCQRAEAAWKEGTAPLNAVEGFVRQILGWREYVRGLYWLEMPDYGARNFLDARRSLPEFYWTGETQMRCMREAISHTARHAYSHHIQRLMVTGNFALLAGLHPDEVNEWYMIVYADAYEWVELPNTHGMALFADGGKMASKPYAASANYIDKMSDYCGNCEYDPKARTGETACPFNFLYWDFLARNENKLRGNPRMSLSYRNLDRKPPEEIAEMRNLASDFLSDIGALARENDEPD